ncbi:hypothetical protein JXB11_04185 [Candidatus Woesearchaeota archaeon]|nr:hypothetical protein [Candidatus Woesearchaeota archaeon]
MKKVRQAIESLGYEDLINIQKDILTGSTKLRGIISSKLKDIEEAECRICATCGSTIKIKESDNFTIIFGPPDFKKRASFCALDCMEYFITSLKRLSEKKAKANI